MARAAQSTGPAAKPASTSTPERVKQATNVMAIIDAVGALSSGTLAGSLFLFDNNRWAGSTGHGASRLSTVAQEGDVVVWTTMALECEAFVRLELVMIDIVYTDYIELDAAAFSETPEIYWFAKVLKPLPAAGVPYRLSYRLGNADEPYFAPVESRLVPPPLTLAPVPGLTEKRPLEPNQGDAK